MAIVGEPLSARAFPVPRTASPPIDRPQEAPDLVGIVKGIARAPGGPARLAVALGCVALLGALFFSSLSWFWFAWSNNENYSHGFLVPLIALYFANEAARRGPIAYRPGARLGLALLVGAALTRWATVLVPIGFARDLAFLVALAGLVAALAGRAALLRFGFALAFLGFMVPVPDAVYKAMANPLQFGVSQGAAKLLNVMGVPVLCEGNMMTLPGGVKLFVAEACSGMRQLTGFFALSTAVAWLGSRPTWARALIVLSSLPIAMAANLVRVVLTGSIIHAYGAEYASGTYHTLEGLLMMGLGLALLAGEVWLIGQVVPGPQEERR